MTLLSPCVQLSLKMHGSHVSSSLNLSVVCRWFFDTPSCQQRFAENLSEKSAIEANLRKMFHSFGPIFCMALNTGRIGRTKQTIVAAEFHLDSHKLWIFQLGSENSKRALRPGISFPDGRLWARVTLRTCLATVHFQVDRLLMGLFALFWWLIRSLFSCRNGTRAGLSLG